MSVCKTGDRGDIHMTIRYCFLIYLQLEVFDMHTCLFYRGNINCSYVLPLVEISVDDLNGGDNNCDICLQNGRSQ
jgi:hypothetical protein